RVHPRIGEVHGVKQLKTAEPPRRDGRPKQLLQLCALHHHSIVVTDVAATVVTQSVLRQVGPTRLEAGRQVRDVDETDPEVEETLAQMYLDSLDEPPGQAREAG